MDAVRWRDGEERELLCRACGYRGSAAVVGEFDVPLPPDPFTAIAARCPDCGTVDLLSSIASSTTTDAAIDDYLEMGAGIAVIAELVDSLGPADGRRLLDVGCGYGFGIDYARTARGWNVVGVEPSRAGLIGGAALGVDIRPDFFGPGWSPERFDAILTSEVLEHVPDPAAFVGALAEHLRPDGQLVLTTPDPAVIDPSAAPMDTYSALSAGYHLALYSRAAVERMLRDAGFRRVEFSRVGPSHLVVARLDGSPPVVEPAQPTAVHTAYLVERAGSTTGSLAVGLSSRALRSAVADGDFERAGFLVPVVRQAFVQRHGFDPTIPAPAETSAARGAASGALGGVSFALGMRELLEGTAESAVGFFESAVRAIEAWRRAATHADADSVDLLRQSRYHLILARLRVDPDVAGIETLAFAHEVVAGVSVESAQLARLYVELVARGRLDAVADVESIVEESSVALARSAEREWAISGRDAQFSLAIRAVQRGEWARARRLLSAAHESAVLGPFPSTDLAAAIGRELVAITLDHGTDDFSRSLDVFWADASGAYLNGWIHHRGDPGTALRFELDGVAVDASRHERADLEAHWPDAPQVRHSGFRVYLPSRPGTRVDVVLSTADGDLLTSWDLPQHQLPEPPTDVRLDEIGERVAAVLALAPGGPVLSIGARADSPETPLFGGVAFEGRRIVGFDIHPGHRVDIVGDAHRLSSVIARGEYPVIYSGSLLEHVAAPWLVAAEIARALPVGGIAIQVVPWLWPTHSQPNDFWRISDGGLRLLFGPELGFEFLDGGSCYPAAAFPNPSWRSAFLDFGSHHSDTTAWIATRKIDDSADTVAWPYDADVGRATAEEYPLDGIARADA